MTGLTLPLSQSFVSARAGAMIIVCVLAVSHALTYNQLTDDAHITFRYSQHLADGLGAVWNAGERVEGYTSPAWMLLLAFAARVGLNIPATAWTLGIGFGILTLLLVTRLAQRFNVRPVWFPAALLAANSAFAYWMTGGLEMTLFTAVLSGAVLLTIERCGVGAGAAWGLAYLVRPEGAALFLITLLFLAARRENGRKIGRMALAGGGLIGGHILWRLAFYGYPLPNTFYVKVGGDILPHLWRGASYVSAFVIAYFPALLALPYLIREVRRRDVTYLLWLVLAYLGYLLYVGGDGLAQFRFVLPALPFLYILAALGWMRVRLSWRGHALLIALTLAPSLGGVQTLEGIGRSTWNERGRGAAQVRDWQLAGEWLRDHLPAHTRIAVQPAGIIPYVSALPALDMLGLNDAHIAHLPVNIGNGKAGHEKWDAAYVLAQQPTIIIPYVGVFDMPIAVMTLDEMQPLVGRARVDADLWASEEFHACYAPQSARLANGRWLNYFQRTCL